MPFKKAQAILSKIKVGIYGKQGSGKTFTSLLFAEGLARKEGKRIAFVDTEGGTDFYTKKVLSRPVHPEAFDFDAIYTRSLSEVLKEVKAIDFNEYGVIVLDSITHIWEAAKGAYEGKRVGNDAIPLNAWADIKRPYKELINFLMNCNAHVFVVGREGLETENEKGNLNIIGTKMKAEGETAYEPHILIHMQQMRKDDHATNTAKGTILAYFEKDRTGLFNCKSVSNPTYKDLEPAVQLLSGDEQRHLDSEEEASEKDALLIDEKRQKKEVVSKQVRLECYEAITKCKTLPELIEFWQNVPLKKMYKHDQDQVIAYKDEMKIKLTDKEIENG